MYTSAQLVKITRQWMDAVMHRSMRDWSHFVKATDLSMPQFSILMQLHYQGECGMSDVSERMDISAAAASQLVEKLVISKLIERAEDPNDRRANKSSSPKRKRNDRKRHRGTLSLGRRYGGWHQRRRSPESGRCTYHFDRGCKKHQRCGQKHKRKRRSRLRCDGPFVDHYHHQSERTLTLQASQTMSKHPPRQSVSQQRNVIVRAASYLWRYRWQAALPISLLTGSDSRTTGSTAPDPQHHRCVTKGVIATTVLDELNKIPAAFMSQALPKILGFLNYSATMTRDQLVAQLNADKVSAPNDLIRAALFIVGFAALRGLFAFLQAFWQRRIRSPSLLICATICMPRSSACPSRITTKPDRSAYDPRHR